MRLYKYRSLSSPAREHTLDVIRKCEVYFSSPDKFNDPFEFRPNISLECTDKEFTTYLDGLYIRRCPWMNRQQRREQVASIVRDKSRNHRSPEVARVLADAMSEFTRVCGVLSLSEECANILMWAHYADNHTGVCFGFNGSPTNPFFGRAQKVSYSGGYPTVNLIRDDPMKFHEKGVLTKADFWAYEREWRILEHEKGAGAYRFQPNDLEEVVFGMNTPKDSVKLIQDTLSSAGISANLRRAVPHKSEFKLELVDEAA